MVVSLAIGVVGGHSFWPSVQVLPVAVGTSAEGTTGSTPRMSQIVANANDSTSYVSSENKYQVASLYNADSQDRIVESVSYFYDALATVSTSTAAMTLQAATSSSATTLGSNTNYVLSTTVATSTPVLYVASTTPGLTGTNANRIWKAGSYLNFFSNATTSSSQVIKVNYIAS